MQRFCTTLSVHNTEKRHETKCLLVTLSFNRPLACISGVPTELCEVRRALWVQAHEVATSFPGINSLILTWLNVRRWHVAARVGRKVRQKCLIKKDTA